MESGAANEKLAIDGGPRLGPDPWPRRRLFGQEEKAAVMELFDRAIAEDSKFLGYDGPIERLYCEEFAESLGGGFADGVNSGTNAVYVALRALEIPPFSEVIVPAVSDPGGIMPVAMCNCIPIPADTSTDYYSIGAEQIKSVLTERTKAIVVAHIAGLPADMDPIMELARSRNLLVIEDCAQIHGAQYKGRMVGSIGDISAFSTMFGKQHATGGQGGVVFTKDEDLYWRVRRHADRGKPHGLENRQDGNVVAAINCSMDELHATLGRVQLKRLPEMNRRRREMAHTLARGCKERLEAVRLVVEPTDCMGVYWFLLFDLDLSKLTVDRDRFAKALAAEGLPAGPGYRIVPTEMPWYRNHAYFAASETARSCGLNKSDLPSKMNFPNLDAMDAHRVAMLFDESWTDELVDIAVAALEKVEKAYLK